MNHVTSCSMLPVSINGAQPLSGVSSITEEDSKVFKAQKVKLPSQTPHKPLVGARFTTKSNQINCLRA